MDETNMRTFRYTKTATDLSKVKENRFSKLEIKMLHYMYAKICAGYNCEYNKLEERDFVDFLHVTMNIKDKLLGSFIMKRFMTGRYFTLDNFVILMSLFLRGTLEEKIDFSFSFLTPTDSLKKDRVKNLLFDSHGINRNDSTEDEMEKIDMIMLIVFNVFDQDKNFEISREDFRKTIMADPYLLTVLVQCLPDIDRVKEILLLISTNEKFVGFSYLSDSDWDVSDSIVPQEYTE